MKLYSIFFGRDNLPLFEGKDGEYWLGGSLSNINVNTLIFGSKKQAEKTLKDIKARIENGERRGILYKRKDELKVKKFMIAVVI